MTESEIFVVGAFSAHDKSRNEPIKQNASCDVIEMHTNLPMSLYSSLHFIFLELTVMLSAVNHFFCLW